MSTARSRLTPTSGARLRRAAQQRGPRAPPDRGVRGAGGVPGAGGVAQPACCACSRRSGRRPAMIAAPSSPTWRCHRRAAPGQPGATGKTSADGGHGRGGPGRAARPRPCATLASRARTFDFFERGGVWDMTPERFRLHALATQRAADRLAAAVNYGHRDRLLVTAMLHDVGKLVLLHAYPGYPEQVHGDGPHARGAHPPGASRAGHRPRAGRRGAGPPLGPARARSPR